MATFTMRLIDVVENLGGRTERVNGVTKIIGADIGLNEYPIFDDAHREILNGHIYDYFINREIGYETIGMFTQRMRTIMGLEMPTFNEFYRSQRVEFEILNTVDMRTTSENTGDMVTDNVGETVATANTKSKSRSVASNTPQTMLAGNGDYASSATDSTTGGEVLNSGNEESTSTTSSSNDGNVHVTGYQGVPSSLIMQFRDSIINVDKMIIDMLEPLFMSVWDNGDAYTKGLLR